MKVLHITPAYFPAVGGIETVVRELSAHLSEEGIVADVLHVSPANREWRKEHLDGSTVWRVPLFPNRLVGVTPSIRGLLLNYDLLHVHDPQGMALSANVLLQGRGRKKLLSTHGGYFHSSRYGFIKQLHWRMLAGPLLKEYDAVLASSTTDCTAFQGKAPHVQLVPNGINVSKFAGVQRSPGQAATRWLYFGRLSRNKRIDVVIDTVKQIRDTGVDVTLTIAGADFDDLLPSIRARIASHQLKRSVRILDPLSDAELLAECAAHTVFITASEYEGFGVSIFEAMAAGLVVICRDMAPLNSFVTPGQNGLLVGFDGSAADVASIKTLCSAPAGQLAAMQESSRAAALPHSWDTVVKRYVAVYDDLMRC